jgi:hypothetical protein
MSCHLIKYVLNNELFYIPTLSENISPYMNISSTSNPHMHIDFGSTTIPGTTGPNDSFTIINNFTSITSPLSGWTVDTDENGVYTGYITNNTGKNLNMYITCCSDTAIKNTRITVNVYDPQNNKNHESDSQTCGNNPNCCLNVPSGVHFYVAVKQGYSLNFNIINYNSIAITSGDGYIVISKS